MAIKTYCDICGKEISEIDRTYFVSYGEKKKGIFDKALSKSGSICYECAKAIQEFIQKRKK